MSMTTIFDRPLRFSSNLSWPTSARKPCNFITFLATAQRLRIPFLQITWDLKRPIIGSGGTSRISQSQTSLQASFAFKRIGDVDKLAEEKEIFRCLINEIMILGHPEIRRHANIVELQGICWDIPLKATQKNNNSEETLPSHKIWPVLVFSKSQLGDLYQFASSSVGKELDIDERVNICLAVGRGIGYLSSHNIIHGDIKPQNVLVFKSNDGLFTPKIADFGCSVWSASANDQIEIHGTPLWRAPECDEYPYFTKKQAFQTEVFSFGMLCLWFIFERYFLMVPSHHDTPRTNDAIEVSLQYLANMKRKGSLAQFADRLAIEANIDARKKQMLRRFFGGCLACNPEFRDLDIHYSLKHLNINQPDPINPLTFDKFLVPEDDDFSLYYSLHSFYISDFRLRSYILENLEKIILNHPESPLSEQVSIAYKIGFGHPNNGKASLLTTKKEVARIKLKIFPFEVNISPIHGYQTALYSTLLDLGHISVSDNAEIYRQHNIMEEAERTIKYDIMNIERVVGMERPIVVSLKFALSSIMGLQEKFQEVVKLELENLNTIEKLWSHEHITTIIGLSNLAETYLRQGKYQEAEKLWVEAVEISVRLLGEENPHTLKIMSSQALIYYRQGRYGEAEKLVTKVVDISKRVLGHEHEQILRSINTLAAIYFEQGRVQEAKKLYDESLATRQRILDQGHVDVESSMQNLTLVPNFQRHQIHAEHPTTSYTEATNKGLDQENLGINFESTHTSRSMEARLLKAAVQGNMVEVEFLITMGGGIETMNEAGETPLSLAALKGHESVVKLLLEKGANIEAQCMNGNTPLSLAAKSGHITIAELLISKGADIEATHALGRTTLCNTVETGNLAMIELLIAKGADINAGDDDGNTPLFWAATLQLKEVLELLLDKGANLEARNHETMTPLLRAIEDGGDDIVKLLIDRGADIETRDERGWTALFWAVVEDDETLVKLLLDKGADTSIEDNSGHTPISWAVCNKVGNTVQNLIK